MHVACLASITRNILRVTGKNQSFFPDECVFPFFVNSISLFSSYFFSRESEYPSVHYDVACPCLHDRKYNVHGYACVCVCVVPRACTYA